jgi:HD-GYP domain-containing protein (c-di-GMP phosphodiesterase class II)
VTTRFRSRAFLICFVPFAALLAGSFWMMQRFVQATVHDGLRASLRETQSTIANMRARGAVQNSRFLRVAGENASLKAGIELLLSNPGRPAARRTVEDQLRELGEHMGFDFLLVSASDGAPLAGVVRQTDVSHQSQLVPLGSSDLDSARSGLLALNGRVLQVASVAIDQDNGNLGSLSVGEYFTFSGLASPAVLLRNGKAIASNIPDIPLDRLSASLAGCGTASECDLRLESANWISAPLQSWNDGYLLRSLANVDAVTAPIQTRLRRLFFSLAAISFAIVFLASVLSARSIVKPISAVVSHLQRAASTGVLARFKGPPSPILEIRELAEIYNHAAASVRASGEKLEVAYLEFVGSLASALDARDPYTSGHSHRVSQLSCAIASAMDLAPADIERIRIGALLHDIGKIGIADRVLQKPGRLNEEEWELIKQHPVIGRRILEGVNGFALYLGAVELHHENWDGSGYPHGQRGTETPIDARIIHVADAYDAMTTDRSYRSAMSDERATSILRDKAGRQFDAQIVAVFLSLAPAFLMRRTSGECTNAEAPVLAVAE